MNFIQDLPSSVVISIVEPRNLGTPQQQMLGNPLVKAGSPVVALCQASNSNPEPMTKWYRDGYPILANSTGTFNSSSVFVKNDYNGMSYLNFTATSSDHMKEIRCDVNVVGFTRTMHGSLTLAVKCKFAFSLYFDLF